MPVSYHVNSIGIIRLEGYRFHFNLCSRLKSKSGPKNVPCVNNRCNFARDGATELSEKVELTAELKNNRVA